MTEVNLLKKINSTHLTAFIRKIHCENHTAFLTTHRIASVENCCKKCLNVLYAVKKISPHFSQKFNAKLIAFLTNSSPHLFFNVCWIGFKFTRKITEAGDRWCSGLRSCRLAGGERWKLVSSSFFFVRIPLNAMKINNSPLLTAKSFEKYFFIFTAFQRVS